jgi:hypothetical protein
VRESVLALAITACNVASPDLPREISDIKTAAMQARTRFEASQGLSKGVAARRGYRGLRGIRSYDGSQNRTGRSCGS